ncbi:hypothetical protein [Kitasatospora cineracea]|uniref:SPP1 Gp6-like portal protein n=1 Tax=Kitasatospora cineracea TaxID=88074 RepID=A0A3N4RHN2_9ACTN|nr:hypothetical protein [Kitasatospora cineracea]RPE26620.1 hypothetical protein EDD38_7682 [Kitasatospora cineracea]
MPWLRNPFRRATDAAQALAAQQGDAARAFASSRPRNQVQAAWEGPVPAEGAHPLLRSAAEWQRAVSAQYKASGPFGFAIDWMAGSCARSRLYVGRTDPDGSSKALPIASTDPDADTLLAPLVELFDGDSQAALLGEAARCDQLFGEWYLIGWDDPDAGRRWRVFSPLALLPSGRDRESLNVHDPDQPGRILELPLDTTAVIRVWQPDPDRPADPYSHTIRALPILARLSALDDVDRAAAQSRIAMNGMLLVPSEASFPNPDDPESISLGGDQLPAWLMEVGSARLTNPGSAAAAMPVIAAMSADMISKVRLVDFSTSYDSEVEAKREAALRQLAVSLQLPAEVLTGLADLNHWSLFGIQADSIRLYVVAVLDRIAGALTREFLRPALAALGVDHPEHYQLGLDITDLTLRPNRAELALQAFDRGLISRAACIAELGFPPEAAPTEAELAAIVETSTALTDAQSAHDLVTRLLGDTTDRTRPGRGPGRPRVRPLHPVRDLEAPPADRSALPPGTTG